MFVASIFSLKLSCQSTLLQRASKRKNPVIENFTLYFAGLDFDSRLVSHASFSVLHPNFQEDPETASFHILSTHHAQISFQSKQ
jgi:hypothetical protein